MAWIEALVSARSEYSLNGGVPCDQNEGSFSTEKLRNRLHAEGVGEATIKDCEQIIHSEFSQYHTQMKQRCEDYLNFIGSLPRELEVIRSWSSFSDLYKQLIKFPFLIVILNIFQFNGIYIGC